jgi:ARC6-like, IMS domain
MKRSVYVLLIGLATISCTVLPAQARQWLVFFENDAVTVMLDIDSIKGVDNIRNFWIKNVHSSPKTVDYQQISVSLARSWVNCDLRKIGTSQVVGFDKQGFPIVDSGDKKEPDNWSSVLPDTSGEAMLDAVCELRSTQSDAILRTPKQNIYQSKFSQSAAASLVRQWLKAKGSIFGRSYDKRPIEQLTTGKLYQDLTSPKGPVSWLKNNELYYVYSDQEVEKIKSFNERNGVFIVEAYVRESSSLFEGGKLAKGDGGSSVSLVKYEFVWNSDSWKLRDYKVLNK